MAAADRVAVHHRDDGLRDGADHPVEPVHVHAEARAARVAAPGPLALVAAGRERLVSGAGQHDDPHLRVAPGGAEGADQLVHGLGAEGVAHFGAVDGDPGDAVAGVVEDVVVGHGVSWLAACYAGPVACDSPS